MLAHTPPSSPYSHTRIDATSPGWWLDTIKTLALASPVCLSPSVLHREWAPSGLLSRPSDYIDRSTDCGEIPNWLQTLRLFLIGIINPMTTLRLLKPGIAPVPSMYSTWIWNAWVPLLLGTTMVIRGFLYCGVRLRSYCQGASSTVLMPPCPCHRSYPGHPRGISSRVVSSRVVPYAYNIERLCRQRGRHVL